MQYIQYTVKMETVTKNTGDWYSQLHCSNARTPVYKHFMMMDYNCLYKCWVLFAFLTLIKE
jgi:hypothetical protein